MKFYRKIVELIRSQYAKRPRVTIATGILLILIIILVLFSGSGNGSEQSFVVERRALRQEVTATGEITPVNTVTLSFERAGRVSAIRAAVGTKVVKGQELIALVNTDVSARLLSAMADRDAQAAAVAASKRGARPEELLVEEAKVESARVALSQSKITLFNGLQDAFTKADDAVHNDIDLLFSNPRSSHPIFSPIIADSQLVQEIQNSRVKVESILLGWSANTKLMQSGDNLEGPTAEAIKNLQFLKLFADNIATAINATTNDSWKADALAARTSISTALSNLQTASEAYSADVTAYTLAKRSLDLKQAGNTIEDIEIAEAKLRSLEAAVLAARAEYEKTIIRAPFDGVVTRQDAKVGEIVPANKEVTGLISQNAYQLEVNIPEVDIPEIALGNTANFTLDALGDTGIFEASVSAIDPAETVIDGVSTYKTTLQFGAPESRMKPGMTATVNIITGERNDVLAIPRRAIMQRDGTEYVRVRKQGSDEIEEQQIQTGLVGSDNFVEVTKGLTEGDVVIVGSGK